MARRGTHLGPALPRAAVVAFAAVWVGAALVPGAGPGATLRARPLPSPTTSRPAGPCDSLELSSPHGRVLESGRFVLRWRAERGGPFEVRVLGEDGETAFSATTFGHELRVLVNRGEGTMRGPATDQLEPGRDYQWTLRPVHAPADAECPAARFRILSAEESAEASARFEQAAVGLRRGTESAEPAAGMAMAKLYADQGFYVLAERELEALVAQGWDDPAIDTMLADLYRKTGRTLSLRAMPGNGAAGP